MKSYIRIGGVVVGLTALGCRDEPMPTDPHAAATASSTAAFGALPPARDGEAYLAEIAREVPEFGGYYVDAQGVVHVWVTQSGQSNRARDAVAAQFQHGRVPGRGRGRPTFIVDTGRYTFAQLAQWREDILAGLTSGRLPAITLIDLDEVRNRVRVATTSDFTALRQAVAAIGVDTGALLIEPHSPLRPASRRQSYPHDLNSPTSPVIGGVGVRWSGPQQSGGCTLGFVASTGGVKHFVTAAHCTEIKFSLESTLLAQPFSTINTNIGTEIADPNPSNCWLSYYAFWALCRASDAALFSVASGVSAEVGLIARTTTRNNGGFNGDTTSRMRDQTNPYWVVDAVEQNNWYAGLAVDKVGMTTGWTWGTIVDTCFDYLGPDGQKGITCAYAADMRIEDGDSGGPVFYMHAEGDGRVTLGGILAGKIFGKSVFSKFSRVNNDLGGNLNAVRSATLGTPTLSGSLSGVAPTISWPATSGATFYRVYRQWYSYASGMGSNGFEVFKVTTNSFTDPNLNADAYTGSSTPNFSTPGYVKYYVRPMSLTESGGSSAVVNFRLSP